MSFQSFPFQFLTAGQPIVNSSGVPTTNSLQFLLSIFNRSGSSDGIVPIVKTGLIAAGNSQTTALLLGADWNEVDTVAAGTGVQMPTLSPGNDIWIWNNGNNTLNVYPFGGAAFRGEAINAAKSLAAGALGYFQCWQTTLLLQVILNTSP